jgi:hypothetical protein
MPRSDQDRPTRQRIIGTAVATVALEALSLWARSGKLGGNIIVRCRNGHLFTTIWIPAASVKSLRLGPWRVQRCPIGHHWTVVTPVKAADLSAHELRVARRVRDIRLP